MDLKVDADGSLYLSIEETNKLRISLGLKPLKMEEAKSSIQIDDQTKPNEEDEHDVKKRIELVKYKRRERELKKRKTLGEDDDDSDNENANGNSAQDWVTKSRKLEKEQKDKIEEHKEAEKVKYSIPSSMPISHSKSKLIDFASKQENVILTLQDKSIFDEEEDALENVYLDQQEKVNWNQNRSKKTNELLDTISNMQNDRSNSILSKYDDPNYLENASMQKETFSIGQLQEKGIITKGNIAVEQVVVQKEDESSNVVPTHVVASDFKPISIKKRKSKMEIKKSAAQELEDSITTLEENPSPSFTIQSSNTFVNNFVDRNRLYENALIKAREKSKILKQDNTSGGGHYRVVELLDKIKQEEDVSMAEQNNNKIVLDSTMEFTKQISIPKEEEEEKKPSIIIQRKTQRQHVRQREEEEPSTTISQESSATTFTTLLQPIKTEESHSIETASIPLVEEEEPLVGSSLSAALNFAKQKGFISSSHNTTTTQRNHESQFDIQLDKRDEFGQLLTKKQEYKQLGRVFHMRPPSKNTLEKERRRMEQEMKRRQQSDTDTPLGAMEMLTKVQEKTHQPYLVVDNTLQTLSVLAQAQQEKNGKEQQEKKKNKKKK